MGSVCTSDARWSSWIKRVDAVLDGVFGSAELRQSAECVRGEAGAAPSTYAGLVTRRFQLNGIPSFVELIAKIAASLHQSGITTGTLKLAGDPVIHTFPLSADSISFEDHGRDSESECLVCDKIRDRRYIFFVKCDDGVERGPIGSGCIFEHVLSRQEAKQIGAKLFRGIDRFIHEEQQQQKLTEMGSYYEYLKSQQLEWSIDATELRRTKLSDAEFKTLYECRTEEKPIPLTIYKKLKAHTPLSESEREQAKESDRPKAEFEFSDEQLEIMRTAWQMGLSSSVRGWRKIFERIIFGGQKPDRDAYGALKRHLEDFSEEVKSDRLGQRLSREQAGTHDFFETPQLTFARAISRIIKKTYFKNRSDVQTYLEWREINWLADHMPEDYSHFQQTGMLRPEIIQHAVLAIQTAYRQSLPVEAE